MQKSNQKKKHFVNLYFTRTTDFRIYYNFFKAKDRHFKNNRPKMYAYIIDDYRMNRNVVLNTKSIIQNVDI